MFKLFVDTDMDFGPEDAKKYDLGLISMPIVIGEEEIFPYEEGPMEAFDAEAYYGRLRGGLVPKTCGLNIIKYKTYFEPVLKEGKDILYAHFSESMSGTFNAMRLAIEELKESYPERRIEEVDTLGITSLGRVIVLDALPLYKEGKSLDEVKAHIEEERSHYACVFFADDLKFFKASGRVSGFSALLGGAIGIKPIIGIESDGVMRPIAKAVGSQPALRRLFNDVKAKGDRIGQFPFVIVHSGIDRKYINILEGMLKKEFGEFPYEEIVLNPTAGAHSGPDCLGVAFHAKSR